MAFLLNVSIQNGSQYLMQMCLTGKNYENNSRDVALTSTRHSEKQVQMSGKLALMEPMTNFTVLLKYPFPTGTHLQK